MNIINMIDLNLVNKRVLIRSDLNVPIKDGKVMSDIRIKASLPTIEIALKKGARVMVTSHLGRPKEGEYNSEFSLKPVVDYLNKKLSVPVRLVKDYLNGINITINELIILENVRFNKGEIKNDKILAQKYASLCDIFIMDAFGTAHRSHASTCGVSEFATLACAGTLLLNEVSMLSKVLNNPARPMIAIVGGSKISNKLTLLDSLSKIADQIIVGGGIANTFFAAQGYKIGKSLYEANLVIEAKNLLKRSNIFVSTDVRVANEFSEKATFQLRLNNEIKDDEYIMDLGDTSSAKIEDILKEAKTILWNGPIGVFEFVNFRRGTEMLAHAIANSTAFSVAGGGDTLAAIDMFGIANRISYISTGGGAFLEFIKGKKLPAIVMLEKHAKKYTV